MKKAVYVAFGALLFVIGLALGTRIDKNPKVIINDSTIENTLSEWEIMKLAIIYTESEGNPLAIGKNQDLGCMQITPIYVKEVNRILGEEKYSHEDAFNPEKSMEMFTIMQNHHNPENDIDRAIASHNPTASSAYSVKVRKNMKLLRSYEEYRNLVKEGN
jgi:hypothetical protein